MDTNSQQPSSENDSRRQFVRESLVKIQSTLTDLTPNIPYTAGTFSILIGLGMEHEYAVCFGLIVGWLNKQPKK